jgi:transcriptional regulator with XRE-family HTH domain
MELLSVIRRWRLRDHFSIREISRRTGLSRNTVRKYLRSDIVEPKFNVADRTSKLDPYADKLSRMLLQEAGKSRKQKRTIKQLHADLAALGYNGSYNRVGPYYSDVGRPSIDPELMMRMLIVGYCFGIRSERRLCEEVHLNLAYPGSVDWGLTAMSLSFDVFQEPPRPVSRERSPAQAVRDGGGALHEGRHRRGRSLRGRRRHYRGRRPSPARRRQDRGPRSDLQPCSRGVSVSPR